MDELDMIREEIDRTDDSVAELLKKRRALALRAGKIKEDGSGVIDGIMHKISLKKEILDIVENEIKSIDASDGSIKTEVVYENEYDSAGKKIKNTEYIIEGKNKKVLSELKYNENEILTEKIWYIYYQGDIISCVNLEEYDNQGNLLKEVITDSDGSSDQKEYEYDSRGNQIKYTHINRDGSVYKEESEYDDKGNIIRWTRSTDGVTDKEEKYEYGYRE